MGYVFNIISTKKQEVSQRMKKMTQANLETAFAGESQAHMKYANFADKAEKEGYSEVARLFRAISYAERVHATNHLRTLGGIGDTVANLTEAIGGENYENTEMYPAFDAVARLQERLLPAGDVVEALLPTDAARALASRRALREAVQSGVVQAIASHHRPHEAEAKRVPFAASAPGISSVEILLPLALTLAELKHHVDEGRGVVDQNVEVEGARLREALFHEPLPRP